MKVNNKKTTKKQEAQSFKVGTKENVVLASVPYTFEDFKNSLLIVSILVNMFFLTGWLTIQVSQEYALVVAQSLVQ